MQLIDLMEGQDMPKGNAPTDLDIAGLTCDSRAVRPGMLFAALPGMHHDGRAFIEDAVERGAAAVLAPAGTAADDIRVPVLVDDNPRRAFARMAATFYGQQPETVAAVTGTNGKTSVAWFARQLWQGVGCRAASLGTLGLAVGDRLDGASLTTPDPVALHQMLAELAGEDVRCLAMEASSHGLDQYRLDGVRIGIGAFTNLSRDHLDYHGDMETYLGAKMRLFTEVMAPGGVAVLNADVHEYAQLEAAARGAGHRVLSVGVAGKDVRLVSADPVPAGQRVRIDLMGTAMDVTLPLAGRFQVDNALLALGMVMASERAEAKNFAPHLGALAAVPGRMEKVGETKTGGAVFVDYAHTPDALETVLIALRAHAMGKLAVVFGCGGDRDRGKRAEMGAVAARLADRIIVTDDNPRGEDAATIRKDVLAACPDAEDIGDRATAIAEAVASLGAGDVLVIAGKGHETGQIIGDQVLPFDDRKQASISIEGGRA